MALMRVSTKKRLYDCIEDPPVRSMCFISHSTVRGPSKGQSL